MAVIGGLSIGIIVLAIGALFLVPVFQGKEEGPRPTPTMTIILEKPEWIKE